MTASQEAATFFSTGEIMRFWQVFIVGVGILLFTVHSNAQRTEITISFSEQFFDTLLDAIYQNGMSPEFSLSRNGEPFPGAGAPSNLGQSFAEPAQCRETIKLLRELNGVRTAIRFRDGKIYAPLAFSGNYNPPLIGCVGFSGIADTNVELEYDQPGQRLVARARVLNVNLSGAGGMGGNLVAKMVQNAIDRKVNPIEIVNLEKVSFPVPVAGSAGLKMKAVGFRQEITNGSLNVHVIYEFVK